MSVVKRVWQRPATQCAMGQCAMGQCAMGQCATSEGAQ